MADANRYAYAREVAKELAFAHAVATRTYGFMPGTPEQREARREAIRKTILARVKNEYRRRLAEWDEYMGGIPYG